LYDNFAAYDLALGYATTIYAATGGALEGTMAKFTSMADALFSKLEARILSGEMQPGSRFPSQKEIAEVEQVSRTVVREAVARLEAQGFAVSRQGSGVYVPDNVRYRAFQVTREELGELSDVVKLLEMRLAIEAEMAALAAARRTLADISAMRSALRRMAEVSADPAASAQADAAFHMAIAHATKNHYYVRLMEFLGIRLVPPRNLYLRDHPPQSHRAYAAKVQAEHESILDSIMRMDVARARASARRHMQESLNRHAALSDALDNKTPRKDKSDN
jgi:GntR family transcriptional regulator, transcriptional repressor for pyruvate dehydrogenase complex